MTSEDRPLKSWQVSSALAIKELWHDRKVTFCMVASLASVLAPLLLLFGLKSGIVATLEQTLLQDPRKREIKVQGNYKLEDSWFSALRRRTDVDFLIHLTRSLNVSVDLIKNPHESLESVELIPTALGDPLLPKNVRLPTGMDEILVSHTVALQLGLTDSAELTILVHRKRKGIQEIGHVTVRVIGVLPESSFGRDGIFVPLELLVASEDFRDAFKVTELGFDTGKHRPERTIFARARLYAKTLDDVAPLADFVRKGGIEVGTHAKEIEETKQIEKVLSFIFSVIAWVAVLGAASSLIGNMITNVDRKRHDLSFLRLLGFPVASIAVYSAIQALIIASIGFALAGVAYILGASAFNSVLGSNLEESGFICRLSGLHAMIAYVITSAVVLLAALIGGYRAAKIEPAEALRRS